ncbi:OB-fold nucleic acid binding domain-containing protein [Chelativorans intermedius]|uniref:OB-fold nucleic acid binding domain-containing protein n=1 Tax=Chelativorans intermedius TaxID=515947 RepID=A0ABV6D7Z4_9HYPH|nr:OB-fold nucleic acid binding domain-containing protein [Chelativorans intermedius]MCT8999886.1 OB-fold nucleic acid binding domain-containing protein [Chelativorans intermedius]
MARKGVMFITLEDETAVANLVVWTKVFEKYRRIVLGSAMLGVKGRIQREGDVVHVVAQELTDLSAELASVGSREAGFPVPHGRGDEVHHGSPRPIRAAYHVLGGVNETDPVLSHHVTAQHSEHLRSGTLDDGNAGEQCRP